MFELLINLHITHGLFYLLPPQLYKKLVFSSLNTQQMTFEVTKDRCQILLINLNSMLNLNLRINLCLLSNKREFVQGNWNWFVLDGEKMKNHLFLITSNSFPKLVIFHSIKQPKILEFKIVIIWFHLVDLH